MWDLAVYDDGRGPALYAVWVPTPDPGLEQESIGRFDGHQWSSVGGGLGPIGGFIGVHSLGVFDDGTGPALYAGGGFSLAGNVQVRNIAKWNGSTWSGLGAGTGAYVDLIETLDDGETRALFLGGGFYNVGGGQSKYLARWVGCPNCYSNCDHSSAAPSLNVNDFMCFLNRFAANDPFANCTVDTTINITDFVCFLNKFAAGCP